LIRITNNQKEKIVLGINIFKNISVLSYDNIREHIKVETENVRQEHTELLPPGYQNSRKLYRSYGIDPTKYRPSSEALWRRVKKGGSLPVVNPFVDLTNFLSLKFQIPYGLYDVDKIKGDIEVITGTDDMWYEGIRKDRVSLHGKIVLSDTIGPFGNPSSDSLRASTKNTTKDLCQVIFFIYRDENIDSILSSSVDLYQQFFSFSEVSSYIV